ncbi:MAG: hypothetical protein MI741_03775, partial [Rhodospirillales bacterium]|nr:hypothetical protein [Rhodospirillales bacterium]
MPSRADMTAVIRTQGLLARADVRDRGEPTVQLWRNNWPDLGAAVKHALTKGGSVGRRVWVLDSGVWL